jgi:hypothetical protein
MVTRISTAQGERFKPLQSAIVVLVGRRLWEITMVIKASSAPIGTTLRIQIHLG